MAALWCRFTKALLNSGIQTTINRRANPNGNPRLYGRRPLANWFQEHFKLGDTVTATVIGPHEIILELPEPMSDPDPTGITWSAIDS
jgi:hypothetical protein